ncbi:MAG: hypothetical protein IPK71_16690 [Myxococcales bacterium]|nr:hypothetical protein [Myxococcales bacterium]
MPCWAKVAVICALEIGESRTRPRHLRGTKSASRVGMTDLFRLSPRFALLLALVACSGPIDRDDFTTNTCQGGTILSGVRPAQAGTYIVAVGFSKAYGVFGEKCASAPDLAACEANVASATPSNSWDTTVSGGASSTPSRGYFVIERAGVVSTLGTVAEVAAALGPIDTPAEAVLLASLAYREASASCSENHAVAIDGGYDVLLSARRACNDGATELRVHVQANGAMALVDEYRKEPENLCMTAGTP